MDEHIRLNDIITIYDYEISKHVKHKKKLEKFERHKMEHIANIYDRIVNQEYQIRLYHIFVIYEPKCRIIMSLDLEDKIINHYFTRYHLIPKLDKYLDYRNVATRKGMGTDYGIRLTKLFIEQMKKYDKVYVLKLDISKYFYSINHEVLKSMLISDLNELEFNYVSHVIDSTDEDYVMKQIRKLPVENLPEYKKGYGLGIGNMTSQFLSVFYLSFLDHYIIHDLHLPRMVHYMDDYVIFSNDKKYLEECLEKITRKLNDFFKLQLNPKKTSIVNVCEGFVFLGYNFKLRGKKTIIRICGSTKRKAYKNIRKCNQNLSDKSLNYYYQVINNYLYSFKYANKKKLKANIESYFKV